MCGKLRSAILGTMEWLWSGLTGFALGAVGAPLVEPWSRMIARLGRRISKERPVDVHLEWDQAIIWAGYPPWLSFSYFIPGGLPREPAPESGLDWCRWANRAGGFDLRLSMLKVTIVARTASTVVLETPLIEQDTEPLPEGVGVLWPAPGGADVSPRRYDVRLDWGATTPMIVFRNEHSPSPVAPSWKLGPGDVEQLQIWAWAEDALLHRWTMKLPLLIDGRRTMVSVSKNGEPFVTVGDRHLPYLSKRGNEWVSWQRPDGV